MAFSRQRGMSYLPRTAPPVRPFHFTWTKDKEDELIALYLLGLSTASIANKFVCGVTTKEAEQGVLKRLSLLKGRNELPEDWQRAYYKSSEMTTTEGYTLEEDIELLQWRANGRLAINAQIFVQGNRSASGMCRRADWLCGLPDLLAKAMRIEEEMWEKQKPAEMHLGRQQLCGHCDQRVEVSECLMDGMDGEQQ